VHLPTEHGVLGSIPRFSYFILEKIWIVFLLKTKIISHLKIQNMSWFDLVSILQHFMLEDAIQENHFRSEEEGLQYLISDYEKPCTCPCYQPTGDQEQGEQKEEKKYPE